MAQRVQKEQNTGETASAERAEIERLKGELSQEHDLYLRALADFENYRRRVERERETAAKRAKRVSEGEIEDVQHVLPAEIRDLWP
ncbi:MAG TPA: nucleotide exchange factor GrpE [Candidatus Binatia bacterium]|nr:nucleotide exchange factor GrpE [Candidatus Binatia bacterium]